MSVNEMLMAAAGSGGGDKLYVDDVFSTYLYTANDTARTIENGIDLAGEGGLVWIKTRGSNTQHYLFDTARGANNFLSTNTTNANNTSFTNQLTGFASNGFILGTDATQGGVNNSALPLQCSWTFREAPKFFDVVTWTGNGTAGRTISHSLGSVPGMIIVKQTNTAGQNWMVWHRNIANTQFLMLNRNDAVGTYNVWNNTTPTSTVFSVSDDAAVNASGGTYVAYLFAHDAGGFGETGTDNVISCGSFTTSGALASVNLGYEPQYVLIKRTDNVEDWLASDVMRGMPVGSADNYLRPNSSAAEVAYDYIDPIATGFNIKGLATAGTYIYMAIRRPMKPPTSGTEVFKPATRTGTGATATVTGVGFAPDFLLALQRDANGPFFWDKLRGGNLQLRSPITAAETTGGAGTTITYTNDGYQLGADSYGGLNVSGATYSFCSFRRAPGFFDVVCYTGTGSARTVAHNLGVAPELMIVKLRSTTEDWRVYHSALGAGAAIRLNSAGNASTSTTFWNSTSPTSTVFTVGSETSVNTNGATIVAYLFASVAGVSKVFSFTGNGSSQTINCGFTSGARLVLIKRTDSTGDWYIWDSSRGIVSGNDPRLSLNTTAAEVTSDDSIDPDSSGFVVNQLSATNINVSSATYIGIAIA